MIWLNSVTRSSVSLSMSVVVTGLSCRIGTIRWGHRWALRPLLESLFCCLALFCVWLLKVISLVLIWIMKSVLSWLPVIGNVWELLILSTFLCICVDLIFLTKLISPLEQNPWLLLFCVPSCSDDYLFHEWILGLADPLGGIQRWSYKEYYFIDSISNRIISILVHLNHFCFRKITKSYLEALIWIMDEWDGKIWKHLGKEYFLKD